MSHPDPQHDPENVRIEDAPYAPDEYIDIAHPAKFHNPRLAWRDIAAAKHAEARRAASARRKAHPPARAQHEAVWVVCGCGGNGWHLGRVGSRICEAGCAGAGRRFMGERITDDQE
jgi:hypothetical protein